MSVNNPRCIVHTKPFNAEWGRIIHLMFPPGAAFQTSFMKALFHLFLCHLMTVVLVYCLLSLSVHTYAFLEIVLWIWKYEQSFQPYYKQNYNQFQYDWNWAIMGASKTTMSDLGSQWGSLPELFFKGRWAKLSIKGAFSTGYQRRLG